MSQPGTDSRTYELESRIAALEQLLNAFGQTVIEQSDRLERSRKAEAHLAAIVQTADDAIVTISPDLRITSWNLGAERLLGFTREEALGQRLIELYFPPEARRGAETQILRDFVALELDPNMVRREEEALLKKNGSLVDTSLVATGLFDSEGNALGMSLIMRDISGHKLAEREQALLAAIVHTSDDAIFSLTLVPPEFPVMTWNKGAEKLFGYTAKEAIGRNICDLYVAPELRDHALELVHGDIVSLSQNPKLVRRLEVPARKKDGTQVELSLVISGIYDSSGNLLGVSNIARDTTERKRAESRQALLASIVRSADAAIISLSMDFKIESWNAAAERLFGYEAREAIGRRPSEIFVLEADESSITSEFLKELENLPGPDPGARYFEKIVRRKDGTTFTASFIASGIGNVSGLLIGISIIIRDVTEVKQAEQEQRMLAAIVNASEDAIVSTSLDSTIVSWNRGAEQLFGIAASASIGTNILEFVPTEEHPRVGAAIAELSQTGNPVSLNLHSIREDGTYFDTWLNLFPIYDSSGDITTIAGIGRDITELLRLEREQSSLAAILDASEDSIIAVSTDMRITCWNMGAQKTYGHTSKEAIGQGLDLFLPPEELPAAIEATKHVIESGEPVTWEQRILQKDGKKLYALVKAYPIRDAAGKVVQVAGIGYDITKLKQTETDLREAQEYTRGLIESSVDAMVIVDPDMHISDGNERLAQLTELPKASLFGTAFDSHFTEARRAREAIEKAINDGYVTNVGLTLKTVSGKEIPVSFNASLFYRAGKVFGIFGVARDVTEQRAMERTVLAEREYSRSLVQSSPDAMIVSDSDLTLTDVNQQALELTNYTRADLIGRKFISLFTDPIRVTGIIEKVRDGGLARDIELFLLTKSAQEIPVSLNASSFTEGSSSKRRIVAAVRDISEVKRAQEVNSLLASIVDASGDAIYSETLDTIVTSWNPAAEKLFGYSASEVIGRSSTLFAPVERRGEIATHTRHVVQSHKVERYETVRLRKDGSSVEVAVTKSPIRNAAGAVSALSISMSDISERKRMEAALTEARDAALEGARIKSEFLANMSHEIRTPLNSVIGMTGLLLETSLDAEQRSLAQDARESGEILLSLINDILDFSKIAAGKLVFEETDFNLIDLVEGAADLVSDQARRKGLELIISIEPDVPRLLRGDPTRLRQVIVNLLSNAVKFTETGEIAVGVSKLAENPNDAVVRFEVRDTGIGIPLEKQHLLFQSFTQVDASTSRHYGGTGLGLSIAHKLVEAMQGTIAVTSAPGAGSTFWFSAKFPKQIDTNGQATERYTSLAGVKILIVDDNANSRRILERQVISWSAHPKTAASAEEALAIMRGDYNDLVLLDVMMPEGDGIELARRIRAEPAFGNPPIVFLSSVGSRSEFSSRLAGLEFGSWLLKPVHE